MAYGASQNRGIASSDSDIAPAAFTASWFPRFGLAHGVQREPSLERWAGMAIATKDAQTHTGPPVVVAVLNSSDDTVEMVRIYLEDKGYLVVSAHLDAVKRGHVDLASFVKQHKPSVVVLDIAPPYDRSCVLARHLRSTSPLAGLPFILTTTNERRVREACGEDALEIVGKPYDLNLLVELVDKATNSRRD